MAFEQKTTVTWNGTAVAFRSLTVFLPAFDPEDLGPAKGLGSYLYPRQSEECTYPEFLTPSVGNQAMVFDFDRACSVVPIAVTPEHRYQDLMSEGAGNLLAGYGVHVPFPEARRHSSSLPKIVAGLISLSRMDVRVVVETYSSDVLNLLLAAAADTPDLWMQMAWHNYSNKGGSFQLVTTFGKSTL